MLPFVEVHPIPALHKYKHIYIGANHDTYKYMHNWPNTFLYRSSHDLIHQREQNIVGSAIKF